MLRTFATAAIGLLVAGAAAATGGNSAYSGLEHRTVKTLSEQQVDDLRNGRGMGLALAAELNRYPGPVHVLEASAALGLSAEQFRRTEALFEAMRAEAIPIGLHIIALEAELEALFAAAAAEPAGLERLVMAIAEAQGRLRYIHLGYHVEMRKLLTPRQLARYDEVRGYSDRPGGAHQHRH